jgi:hypothetical protein
MQRDLHGNAGLPQSSRDSIASVRQFRERYRFIATYKCGLFRLLRGEERSKLHTKAPAGLKSGKENASVSRSHETTIGIPTVN